MFRFWLFISGIVALAAVVAGAWGAHGITELAAYPRLASIFHTALLFHLIHSLALFAVAVLFAATDGRRNRWGAIMLSLAASGFLIGIILFSGGIYYQVINIQQTGLKIVPAGGASFMIGWLAVALSTFGYRSGGATR
jgi:uncharacterized membrane protein YgdD (TMEM256/DUF423 family)